MKKKLGILTSIFILFVGYFLFIKPYKNKTKPIEDFIQVNPTVKVITDEMIFIMDNKQDNLHDIDLNNEEEISKLARKEYEQNNNEEIIFNMEEH
ncbi:hypothetical protein AKG34_20070 [Peribacillus butanolivorans]|uniref:hypothetical protein n=1 Tax=Peribacillus butanolivorans TaxID=421767 RepID=UPI0006A6CF5A|nr:hypothetical protein [Peribacillus butanolivorans]KON70845.1 hypothetical protein AKG34_20070 [Peribacillus butanolivorans]KQU26229.1 hypothetical protein ASG65_14380 [Bacillus sp. Leaf13]KRF67715.1 hypothetical protein ASG99_14385 [Bacillus sp. Soil768D1]MED3690926.1 hypothetical protein [Peribacillus butanolivorans]